MFGDLVRELRLRQEWSHDKLARETGLSKTGLIQVEKYEQPKMREVNLAALERGLKLERGQLVEMYERRRAELAKERRVRGDDLVDLGVSVPADAAQRIAEAAERAGMSVAEYVVAKCLPPEQKQSPPRVRPPVKGAVVTKDGPKPFP